MRPADADRNESIAFQDIKYAAKAIARPEGFFADAFDLFRWNWFPFLLFRCSPGIFFIFIETSERLLPEILRAVFGLVIWIFLRHRQTDDLLNSAAV